MHNKGFTLAEVLITLTVIGVVAAITLPTVINNYKKTVTVKQLKAAYTIFSQALQSSVQEYGDVKNWDRTNQNIYAEKYLNPYLKNVIKLTRGYNVKTLHNEGYSSYWTSGLPTYELANGMTYNMRNGIGTVADLIYIQVDINGQKAPNRLGKDVFFFVIINDNNKLIPSGITKKGQNISETDYYCACSKTNLGDAIYSGNCCAGRIVAEGWKITDDYPW